MYLPKPALPSLLTILTLALSLTTTTSAHLIKRDVARSGSATFPPAYVKAQLAANFERKHGNGHKPATPPAVKAFLNGHLAPRLRDEIAAHVIRTEDMATFYDALAWCSILPWIHCDLHVSATLAAKLDAVPAAEVKSNITALLRSMGGTAKIQPPNWWCTDTASPKQVGGGCGWWWPFADLPITPLEAVDEARVKSKMGVLLQTPLGRDLAPIIAQAFGKGFRGDGKTGWLCEWLPDQCVDGKLSRRGLEMEIGMELEKRKLTWRDVVRVVEIAVEIINALLN